MMEIEGDDNIGAVHNDTLIGDEKKNIWKKRIPGDNLLIGDDKKYIWKKRIPGDTMWEDGKLLHLVETRTVESHCLGPED